MNPDAAYYYAARLEALPWYARASRGIDAAPGAGG